MHSTVKNLIDIQKKIQFELNLINYKDLPKIIAVSKTFKIEKILPLIEYGHLNFGENKVQEAIDKWTEIKKKNPYIKLHMLGGLQTNKVKLAVKLFDFIHSVDSEKLAKKIADEQMNVNRDIKIFIQVNIGNEDQKSGINKNEIKKLLDYCNELKLKTVGLMCIPPADTDPNSYFNETRQLNQMYGFTELSMGMSADYLEAAKKNSTYLRIGSGIFGQRF
jgi:pyridoxal phosphate enzyme (YggS family)